MYFKHRKKYVTLIQQGIGVAALAALIALFSGCSSTRWVIEEDRTVDEDEGEILHAEIFLQKVSEPTRDEPVLSLEVLEERDMRFPERIHSKEYLQQYNPRYGFWILGLSTSAILAGMANTELFYGDQPGRKEQILLNSSATLIGVASLLSMRPVNNGQTTGNEKLLRQTGYVDRTDTLSTDVNDSLTVLLYDDEMLIMHEETVAIESGVLSIDLLSAFSGEAFSRDEPGELHIDFEFQGDQYRYSYDISDFMERYIEVTSNNAPLRSNTQETSDNILMNISAGERILMDEVHDDYWFRVQRAETFGYLNKEDSKIIWKPSGIARQEEFADVASGFGSLEIEQNIPEVDQQQSPIDVVIIANDAYEDADIHATDHIGRSIELVTTYAERRLGVPNDRVHTFRNLTFEEFSEQITADFLTNDTDPVLSDSSHVIVYYLGHGLADSDSDQQVYLLPSDFSSEVPDQNRVGVSTLLDELSQINSLTTSVVFDTDFMGSSVSAQLERADQYTDGVQLSEIAAILTDHHDNASVMFATRPAQHAGLYRTDDGRVNNFYGIFTYYFFQSLRQDNIQLNELYRTIERNVTFTSRRLHDRPQDPRIYGNTSIDWLQQSEL